MDWDHHYCLYCEKAIDPAGPAYCSLQCSEADKSSSSSAATATTVGAGNVQSPPHSPQSLQQMWKCPPLLSTAGAGRHPSVVPGAVPAGSAMSPPQSATSPPSYRPSVDSYTPGQPFPSPYAANINDGAVYDPLAQPWLAGHQGKYSHQYPNSLSAAAIEFANSLPSIQQGPPAPAVASSAYPAHHHAIHYHQSQSYIPQPLHHHHHHPSTQPGQDRPVYPLAGAGA